jgi:hypothetical protein
MLPGSVSLSRLRCGKPTCHCARGTGHPAWHLTSGAGGRTRVLHIPAAWVETVGRRVEAGQALQEVVAANAE